jgi:pimeloyl-ACP methyl ester carboxylesterase
MAAGQSKGVQGHQMTKAGALLPRPGRVALIIACVLGSLLVVLVAVGWYYSSVLRSGAFEPDYSPEDLDLRIVSIAGDRVVLTPRNGGDIDSLTDPEIWGLESPSGYAQVAAVLGVDGKEVTREFRPLSGRLEEGDYARLDSFAYSGGPLAGRGLSFRDVAVPSSLGDMPAWKLDGSTDTWVLFVHGWRSDRDEALRILPTVAALGLPSLVITYRNDEEAPRSSDGLIRWGATEWLDVEAAVDYALAQGARSVILYGYSMGGGTSMRFLQQSGRAHVVVGVVLDAPVLDFDALLEFQAGRRNIPGFVVSIGKAFAGWRFDMDWDAMDHVSHVDRVDVPILLFHGEDDDRAPIETSERLARERSDIVTFITVPGAGHVRPWNVDPQAYEEQVRRFLARVAGVPLP